MSSQGSPPPSLQDWQAQVTRDLKGRDFERTLVHHGLDSLDVQPLYTQGPSATELPGQVPYRRGADAVGSTRSLWEMRQLVDSPEQAQQELRAGASALLLRDPAKLPQILEAVDTSLAPLHLGGAATRHAKAALSAGLVRGGLGISVLTELSQAGGLPYPLESAWRQASQALNAAGPGVKALAIQGTVFHDTGASEVQELALILAAGVETLRALEPLGHSPSQVLAGIELRVALDSRMLMGVAKLRALRLLWSRLSQACGVTQPPCVHVQLGLRVRTRRDVWVNILRNSVAVFSGALGGAQSITSLPFADCAQSSDRELARRIARNTQLVLAQEAHLARVMDPAGGAYALESWTQDLAQRAWSRFQRIEAHGGFLVNLRAGRLQEAILERVKARAAQIAHRTQPITGVSQYPLLSERRPELRPEPVTDWGDCSFEQVEPMTARRDAAPFEALRDRGDAAGNPPVFLACIGPASEHAARLGFTNNLLQAGGLTPAPKLTNIKLVTEHFIESGARSACICGADTRYKTELDALARALRSVGASQIFVAGKAKDQAQAWERAGVTGTLHLRCDALAVLTQLWTGETA